VLVSLVLLVAGGSACGIANYPTNAGQVGISVDQAGRPVIAIMTCAQATPMIEMSEGRKPSDPETKQNVLRGRWQARRAFTGVQTFTLGKSTVDWETVRDPGALESDRLFVVDGGTVEDDNASLGGASFRLEDLTRLSPNQVRVADKVESLSTFGAYQCQ
jgi:hypothetical protein